MGVKVEWYKGQQNILLYTYDRQWTWDELWEAFNHGRTMMESVSPKTVHVFIDMSKVGTLPHCSWDQAQLMDELAPENEGLRVVIGAKTDVRQARDTYLNVKQFSSIPPSVSGVQMVRNLAEAENLVAGYGQS